jgi:hypothetical protein
VGLEQGPLSLVSTIEELLEKKSSGSGLENREYGLGIRQADHVAPSTRKSWQAAVSRRYISLADSVHGILSYRYSMYNIYVHNCV